MRHTVHADYALRLMTYLAASPQGTATVSEVAAAYHISRNHLIKVSNRLVHAGLVGATRGRGGGLVLAKDPGSISVGTIMRAAEDDYALVECLGSVRHCRIAGVCRFRELFKKALAAYFLVLDGMTLAEAVRNPDALRGVLGLTGAAMTSSKVATREALAGPPAS